MTEYIRRVTAANQYLGLCWYQGGLAKLGIFPRDK